ncbi:MAG: FtsX-like permease family protein [Ruminococcus flavefaciens]|nr:FtsX-like permease family protein [Ruminococcus flavefaciens]
MNRVLRKRILRDFKSNFMRYLALGLLIVMGMYLVVSMVGASETIIVGSEQRAEENLVEDGQFSVFLPLTHQQEDELTDSGLILEKIFSMDVELDDGSVLRLMKNRENVDLVDLDNGRLAEKNGEIVLEKRYCEEHNLKVGDTVSFADTDFIITGIGSTPDYDMPTRKFSDSSVDSALFGTAFITSAQYQEILDSGMMKAEDYTYAYRLSETLTNDDVKQKIKDFDFDYTDVEDKYFKETISDMLSKKEDLQDGIQSIYDGSESLRNALAGTPFQDGAEELHSGIGELKDSTDEMLDEVFEINIDNLTNFVTADENPRILAGAGDVLMNKQAGLVAGIIVMILFTYVLSVFVMHQIQRESSVIGALYALGAKKKDLIRHYVTLPTTIAFLGGLIGSALGFSSLGINTQMADTCNYFSVPNLETVYPLYLVIYGIVMPPVISLVVNTLVINKKLSQTALSLIKNEQKTGKHRGLELGKMGFVRRFQVRQMLREMRTGITVMIGMIISLLIFMLGSDCYVMCNNVKTGNIKDASYEYMYTLKYPDEEVPDGSEACYMESLSKTEMGYTLDISVIGIDSDNKYFNAQPKKSKSSIVISDAVSQKYDLSVGDKLILSDNADEMDYAFTIDGIANYSIGLTVFMDIDSMRELFGQSEDYYNMLLSDNELNIDEGRIYSVTTKADIERSAGVFIDLMMPMVTTMLTVSVIIFCVVMYLMMGVMIDRASFGISLIQIFGFRTKEIRRLYLNGNLLIVIIGAVIGIPLAKVIMDTIYPFFISNTACGMNLHFPWYLYIGIFAVILAVYAVINCLLVRKIKRITPAEVLKNRE